MRISLIDRSLYYKGLMLLTRKDRIIDDREKKMMMDIGKMLGFDSKFCEERIKELLDNYYIVDTPPVFSTKDIALCFIRDGLKLSASDGQMQEEEMLWLKSVAELNGLGSLWSEEIGKVSPEAPGLSDDRLELRNFEYE